MASPPLRLALPLAAALTALEGTATYLPFPIALRFCLAALAVASLAWSIALLGELLNARLGGAAAALLQAALGNLPELFVIGFALSAQERVLVQAALAGSLLSNGAFLLGLAMIAARRRGGQVNTAAALCNGGRGTLLGLALTVTVLLPGHSQPGALIPVLLSLPLAALLIASYLRWQLAQLKATPRRSCGAGSRPALANVLLLVGASAATAFASDWFLAAVRPAVRALSLPRPFIGFVVVALAANAVEHGSAILLAARGSGALAGALVVGSVAQVGAFLLPVAILMSPLFGSALSFSLPPLYTAAVAAGAVAVMVGPAGPPGRAQRARGLLLLALYCGLAVASA